MPWYINHIKTCKVLNRIANRLRSSSTDEFRTTLDTVTELIWKKQERYYENQRS